MVQLHTELEQERSKNSALKCEIAKVRIEINNISNMRAFVIVEYLDSEKCSWESVAKRFQVFDITVFLITHLKVDKWVEWLFIFNLENNYIIKGNIPTNADQQNRIGYLSIRLHSLCILQGGGGREF